MKGRKDKGSASSSLVIYPYKYIKPSFLSLESTVVAFVSVNELGNRNYGLMNPFYRVEIKDLDTYDYK